MKHDTQVLVATLSTFVGLALGISGVVSIVTGSWEAFGSTLVGLIVAFGIAGIFMGIITLFDKFLGGDDW